MLQRRDAVTLTEIGHDRSFRIAPIARRYSNQAIRGGVAWKPHSRRKSVIHRRANCLRVDWVVKIASAFWMSGVERNG